MSPCLLAQAVPQIKGHYMNKCSPIMGSWPESDTLHREAGNWQGSVSERGCVEKMAVRKMD